MDGNNDIYSYPDAQRHTLDHFSEGEVDINVLKEKFVALDPLFKRDNESTTWFVFLCSYSLVVCKFPIFKVEPQCYQTIFCIHVYLVARYSYILAICDMFV